MKNIVGESSSLPRLLKSTIFLLALLALSNTLILVPHLPQMVYYAVMAGLNLILLGYGLARGSTIGMGIWCFWGVMWASILFNQGTIPAVFQSEQRSIAFLVVMLAVGPWFFSRKLDQIRIQLFNVLLTGMFFVVTLSFLGKIGGFFPSNVLGYYQGCTVHSMLLGLIAGVVAPACVHEAMQREKHKVLFIFCALASLVVLLFASSRSALGASILAIFCYIASVKKYKSNFLGILIPMLFFGLIMMPFFENSTRGIINKSGGSIHEIEMADLVSSRENLWQNRLDEIKEEPLFGVGAHSIRYGSISGAGQVEPGNAWLYVFSSMGIFAFLILVFIVLGAMRKTYCWAKFNASGSLLFSQLIFFAIYMNAEPPITAAGAFPFLYFWLLISIAQVQRTTDMDREIRLGMLLRTKEA